MADAGEELELWIYRCGDASACAGAGTTEGVDRLRRLVTTVPGAVLVACSCLGPCHGAPVVLVTWRSRDGRGALTLSGELSDLVLDRLLSWLRSGAPSPIPAPLARRCLPARVPLTKAMLS